MTQVLASPKDSQVCHCSRYFDLVSSLTYMVQFIMSHEYPNSLESCHYTYTEEDLSFYCSESMAAEARLGKASLISKSIQDFLCKSHKIWKPLYRNEVIKCFYCGVVKDGQLWGTIIRG